MASINDKLERVRKPRVHIKYDVEIEGGAVEKELPFVAGVLGDYSGNNPGEALKPLKERKFVKIDRDNFDQVMVRQKPGLKLKVPNTLKDDDSELNVELQFRSIEDFEPAKIVEQVAVLKELKEARDKLRDLLSKSDRSDQLEQILEKALQDPDKMQHLAKDLGLKSE
jgi:type VI secretion system protein ImpB